MKIDYPKTAENWGEDLSLVKHASQRLEEVLGLNAEKVSAEWNQVRDESGATRYELRITDWSGEARAALSHEELTLPHTLGFRLNMLWSRVLQNRSHIQLKNLQAMGA